MGTEERRWFDFDVLFVVFVSIEGMVILYISKVTLIDL